MAPGNEALGTQPSGAGSSAAETRGSVDWAVLDTSKGSELETGHLNLAEGDITVEEHRTAENVVYYRKTISLTPVFSFSIDEHPDRSPSDLKGFLFKGERNDAPSFSSEWFNVVNSSEAVKLQEEGRLAIEIGQGTQGYEVTRTEFLSDVSLRITRFDGDPCLEPSRRITIRKGSWVAWPVV